MKDYAREMVGFAELAIIRGLVPLVRHRCRRSSHILNKSHPLRKVGSCSGTAGSGGFFFQ